MVRSGDLKCSVLQTTKDVLRFVRFLLQSHSYISLKKKFGILDNIILDIQVCLALINKHQYKPQLW